MKVITTKYHGPTNHHGARVSASDGDGNRVTVSYNHASVDPHVEAALALCKKLGWTGELAIGHTKSGRVFVFVDRDLTLTVGKDGAILLPKYKS